MNVIKLWRVKYVVFIFTKRYIECVKYYLGFGRMRLG